MSWPINIENSLIHIITKIFLKGYYYEVEYIFISARYVLD